MKKIFVIPVFLIVFNSISQTSKNCEILLDSITMQRIYSMPSGVSTPIEGLTVLNKKIRKSLEINPSFCIEGANKMIVEFIVCEDGKVIGERIINDIITADSKNKLLNLITETKWNPGSCNNKFVPTLKRIPIILDFRN